MAYTTPRSWVAGDVLTAAQLNVDVRDNVSFLANPPACRVYRSSTQSIPHNTSTTVQFDTELFDTDSMHSTVSSTTRITFNTAGLYVVSFMAALDQRTDYTGVVLAIRRNGSTDIASHRQIPNSGSNHFPHMTVTTPWKMAATDYVEGTILQNNGASVSTTCLSGAPANGFSAVWVGKG